MENSVICHGKTFKDVFKFYRRKNTKLDLSDVCDFSKYGNCEGTCHSKGTVKKEEVLKNAAGIDWGTSYGMLDPVEWDIFTFTSRPGLIYIRNPFKACGQRYWIVRCLKDYTKKPNRLNIDAHDVLEKNEDWWTFCQREHNTNEGNLVLEKLRWATLGYHHNWDTKEYSEELRSDFPNDLRILCRVIANTLGFPNFNAEAAIINMYHKDSSLSGHTDHSEVNLEAPLFSFSFGQSAIFLIGGKSLGDEPMPLLLESGDIVIMSKEARLCYHGVPRIIESKNEPWNKSSENDVIFCNPDLNDEVVNRIKESEFWKPYQSYVMKSRINMNIRQVLFFGQTNL